MGERIWLVQCKREKVIGPQKLVNYLDEISDPAGLYGVIFAAACDFSKTARDGFREKARELGFEEAHLWGKAEIEDQLFQPKNDHLLFAYFGVSLQTRRRALKSEVRARLATKRKALRALEEHERRPVLLRDATDSRYPWMDEGEKKAPVERRRWMVMRYAGPFHDGLHFELHRYPAYGGGSRGDWDFAEKFDVGPVPHSENPWCSTLDELNEVRTEALEVWHALPSESRYWFVEYGVLPFDNILDIDESGDEWFDKPHIFTTEFQGSRGPFSETFGALEPESRWHGPSILDRRIAPIDAESERPDPERRVRKFRRQGE